MLGLCFSTRHDDEAWLRQRPDLERYSQLHAEMGERVAYDFEPPRPNGEHQVQGLITGVMKFGVIPGAFLWLLYLITAGMQADVKSIKDTQHEHAIESRAAIVRQDRLQGVMIDLLRAQCVNSAKTYQERQSCLMAGASR